MRGSPDRPAVVIHGPDPREGPPGEGATPAPHGQTSFRNILACLDGSELGEGILPYARAVALALDGSLILFRVLEEWTEGPGAPCGPPDPIEWGVRRREARAYLEGLVARAPDDNLAVTTELVQGRAPEQICLWADRNSVDLTVLCSHGGRGRTEWCLAGTARKLIDHVPGSVLLVPAAAARKSDETIGYHRILVPLDGSPRAESVIPVAVRLAAAQRAEVLLSHVVPVPELTRVGPLDAEALELEQRLTRRNERVAGAYLDRLRARVSQSGVEVRTRVIRDGEPRTRIEALIEDAGVDLVVMSAHGHAARTDVPCGTLTSHLITHASIPLLILRERQQRATRRAQPAATRTAAGLLEADQPAL
jgi:nucleotide-binding universal stress UspA family protein